MQAATPFPRHIAVLILATLACSFAANHIAARIAFDHDTGLLLAMLCRAGVTLLALAALVFWRRESLRLSRTTWRWQTLLGLLITVQSFCIYSAVARIPVALALLVVNLSPILLALLTWALGGPRPTRHALAIMGLILVGLVLVLDVPTRLMTSEAPDAKWIAGILFSLTAAGVFALALWVTEHKLSGMAGSVRSMLTLVVVFGASALLGASGVIPGGLGLPSATAGWIALGCLVLLYGAAFSTLFICMPRLNIARNAPVMNMEPVAGMLLGWLVLGQLLAPMQILGGLIVVGGIVLLAYRKN
ncbi:EamA/RhaT family transporter [Pseudomonas sp. Choline-3u-10]|mgnify:FL=1|jgi:drug/metabolite transporter (DMT)-like permease|uniref:EamA family transporter n=1 Tax=Pseudomonadaceae TaxID=135621 RepID=UPI0006180C14|nr:MULTISPECIES: DMT family transporter [Pseudomonadaceae]MAL36271.1 EamA/RhaT family transporter [Pseudomonas sp.]MBU0947408.1 DMT family transporter [Gammaproteobacteria bacterium]KJJ65130.1 membrane protein [Pseudomonas sp. 10B238]MBK3795654.1 EamA family transporter [Stutzerimonas stutzeri]MBK3877991.1 EamA family transporter [Stutzerimonas stutzeri]